jgi:hypothetical protein
MVVTPAAASNSTALYPGGHDCKLLAKKRKKKLNSVNTINKMSILRFTGFI